MLWSAKDKLGSPTPLAYEIVLQACHRAKIFACLASKTEIKTPAFCVLECFLIAHACTFTSQPSHACAYAGAGLSYAIIKFTRLCAKKYCLSYFTLFEQHLSYTSPHSLTLYMCNRPMHSLAYSHTLIHRKRVWWTDDWQFVFFPVLDHSCLINMNTFTRQLRNHMQAILQMQKNKLFIISSPSTLCR